MLSSLIIDNIAVIEHAELSVGNGFSALTGEAGAGKSILIDSLLAAQGFRTSKDLVRNGCDKGSVTALFTDIPKVVSDILNEIGMESDDNSVSVSRTIYIDGKSKCHINGKPANTAILKQVTFPLLNIHGQQDNHSLLDPATHYIYIDRMGSHWDILDKYRDAFNNYVNLKKEFDGFNMDEEEKLRRIESLTYKLNELESAQIVIGEIDKLTTERNIYNNHEKLLSLLSGAHSVLAGEESGVADILNFASQSLNDAGNIDKKYTELSRRLADISCEADEITRELGSIIDGFNYDPAHLEKIEERLDILSKLSRKYGPTEEEMLENLEKFRNELSTIQTFDRQKDDFRKKLNQAAVCLKEKAKLLTDCRFKVGQNLSKAISDELAFMDMPDVTFSVSIEPSSFSKNGADKIEFMISTNPGEPLKPLSKIASGGELSRTMLAILSVLTDKDDIQTLIFDEIDTGVSGRAAGKVAGQLKKISKGKQVICITHLAQIASAADNQYLIEKTIKDNRAFTEVSLLGREQRITEIARLTGGNNITPTILKSADELLSAYNN